MRLVYAFILLLAATSAPATPLDSSISGVYLAPDRICNLVVSRPSFFWNGQPQAWWVAFDLKCLTFAGQFRQTRVVQYVYTGCPSFGAGATLTDYSFAPPEHTSIRAATVGGLSVIRGNDQLAVTNGIGTPQGWILIQSLPSPAPYQCAGNIYKNPRG